MVNSNNEVNVQDQKLDVESFESVRKLSSLNICNDNFKILIIDKSQIIT